MPAEVRTVDAIRAEVKSVDSKINLLAEKIKGLEGQNLTIANSLFKLTERLKKLEDNRDGNSAHVDVEQSQDIGDLRDKFEKAMTENEAIKTELYNLKYTIGLINPLEFVTVRQINEMVDERMEQKLEEMKKKSVAKKEKQE